MLTELDILKDRLDRLEKELMFLWAQSEKGESRSLCSKEINLCNRKIANTKCSINQEKQRIAKL